MTESSSRPVTLFTGQWVDLPLAEVAQRAAGWGYDGLELAASGEHLDIWRASEDPSYLAERKAILEDNGLKVWAISNHLTGQAICDDPIDFRHKAIVRERVWGDGEQEGVRERAIEELKRTAKVARAMGVEIVTGFTGSAIWKYVAMFPPVSADVIEAGFEDFATKWKPILDVFEGEGVKFALEVHPGEIAYDYWSSKRTLEAIDNHPAFGFNWDPSHLVWQGVDPAGFIIDFADHIVHAHAKDVRLRPADGRAGRLSSHLPWGDPRRAWDFVSVGHGDVHWDSVIRAFNTIGYQGPLSVEWEDAGMDRFHGAQEALEVVRKLTWPLPTSSFDDAFSHNS
ncbi:sugar phosphate isomerase/epimerase family protein [Humidisolicoccus flavus]|uniref:sugar phosphate isomerase/epimerase family protein n=1 Tax=Humidisolicoccus flavus TaxID=3111414 RepID=UPI00324D73A9